VFRDILYARIRVLHFVNTNTCIVFRDKHEYALNELLRNQKSKKQLSRVYITLMLGRVIPESNSRSCQISKCPSYYLILELSPTTHVRQSNENDLILSIIRHAIYICDLKTCSRKTFKYQSSIIARCNKRSMEIHCVFSLFLRRSPDAEGGMRSIERSQL
jgi:hypothetical protein